MAKQSTGLTRIIKATGYSWKGFRAAWQNEAAFRQEALLLLVGAVVAFALDFDSLTRVLLLATLLLVIAVELLNSAIEAVVDRIGLEQHDLSGRAKDLGSAAVLVTLIIALLVWVVVLWNYFT